MSDSMRVTALGGEGAAGGVSGSAVQHAGGARLITRQAGAGAAGSRQRGLRRGSTKASSMIN
jgi:hypothetical protein